MAFSTGLSFSMAVATDTQALCVHYDRQVRLTIREYLVSPPLFIYCFFFLFFCGGWGRGVKVNVCVKRIAGLSMFMRFL